ncbi:MAG: glycosyltransferase family 2 protein [Liquorilactobacillus nagelii]|jgi:rhamnosyltransferase|uniref:glycosyltransferase family 2 protein n=1 Tax=Liquorilactobacillus nagelii TaxID=82688 RepID=UPI00242BD6E8|nr:glycosyltransferase family 2 protein [Liquorilactobacillus nagelii]MCI1632793.1 glycosyltransferase family 2 protein [Liquorilactobacillus nagelii]
MKINDLQPKVAIMMATYNGQKYLDKQIDSILNQTYHNWELFISDDKSKDETLEILKKYQKKDSRIKKIIVNNGVHGPFTNFYNIMRFVKKNYKDEFKYFCYCDQDDIWEKSKIEFQVKKIKGFEKEFIDTPILCYSDLRLMDKNGQKSNKLLSSFTHIKLENPYNIFFSHRYVWGTTIIHNEALWDLMNIDIRIPNSVSHDNYIGKYAAAFGKIFYLDKALVNYRRHGDNVSGVPHGYNFYRGLLRAFTKFPTVLENHSKTYGSTLFFIRNVPYKNKLLDELEIALTTGGIRAERFVKEYSICTAKDIFNQIAFKLILYSGMYKYSKDFRI